jgi:hypothetical protein
LAFHIILLIQPLYEGIIYPGAMIAEDDEGVKLVSLQRALIFYSTF